VEREIISDSFWPAGDIGEGDTRLKDKLFSKIRLGLTLLAGSICLEKSVEWSDVLLIGNWRHGNSIRDRKAIKFTDRRIISV